MSSTKEPQDLASRPETEIVGLETRNLDVSVSMTIADITPRAARAQIAAARAQYTWPVVAIGFVSLTAIGAICALGWWVVRGSNFHPLVCGVLPVSIAATVWASTPLLKGIVGKLLQ